MILSYVHHEKFQEEASVVLAGRESSSDTPELNGLEPGTVSITHHLCRSRTKSTVLDSDIWVIPTTVPYCLQIWTGY
jgi:hypothetical protein